MCLLAEFAIGRILTRVRLFVVEVLDESIDPVVARERCASDGRTEASCGIEGTAGVVNT
jgi:hypothetical protein